MLALCSFVNHQLHEIQAREISNCILPSRLVSGNYDLWLGILEQGLPLVSCTSGQESMSELWQNGVTVCQNVVVYARCMFLNCIIFVGLTTCVILIFLFEMGLFHVKLL